MALASPAEDEDSPAIVLYCDPAGLQATATHLPPSVAPVPAPLALGPSMPPLTLQSEDIFTRVA